MIPYVFTTEISGTPISAEIQLYYKGSVLAIVKVTDGFMEAKGFRVMKGKDGEIFVLNPQKEHPYGSKKYIDTTRITAKENWNALTEFIKDNYHVVNENRISLPEFSKYEIDPKDIPF